MPYLPSNPVVTVEVPFWPPCFYWFFGSCFGSHDEAGLLAFEALQGLPSGNHQIEVATTEKRKAGVTKQIAAVLEKGSLTPQATASLRGRLGFAEGQLFATRKLINELGAQCPCLASTSQHPERRHPIR